MNKILLVYGSGGHNEQMKRIYTGLLANDKMNHFNFISMCDDDVKNILTEEVYTVSSVTDKFSYLLLVLKLPVKLLSIIQTSHKVKNEHTITSVISTGPGISIIVSLFFKAFTNAKIIHVETWSRFYSKSLTGRFMYIIADKFFVQNEELLHLYPKAIYKGRL